MILKRYETNNGYRCGCCSGGYSDAEWVEESEMLSFEQLLEKAYDYNNNIDGIINLQYEKDGKVLYGYETYFGKRYTDVSIIIGSNSHRIVADNVDKPYISKSEVLKIWEEASTNG
jgi:hypothetical protein